MISGGITGAGAAKRFSPVRWGVAGNIVVAWVLTLPAAGLFGAFTYAVCTMFGNGAIGPIVISALFIGALALVCARRVQQAAPTPVAP